ncbi:ketopantoate reductase family protein [Marinospirillum insulare]|uniref:2-dehydropantoate 2-reductase n=1 Tax=Marinospirillum insulare TaxID=217169 RepID=A0ABQ5ZXF3_9GAMM|nr:2-dehydropantoate 2-reductase [Marinospirillum insulare]GLR62673.1 putative 2-dehydropantoate 2-reductase [Marinospirillum insulare]
MQQVTYVLGAGSLGLLYAARLALTGKTVCLLVKPSQTSALNLGITLSEGEAALAKRVFVRVRSEPSSEIKIQQLILATKAGQAVQSLKNWQSSLADDAEILMLQNGMGSQAEVAKLLTAQQTLLAASVTEGAYLAKPGSVIHASKGKTQLGRWSGAGKDAAARWASRLTIAGLTAEVTEPIRPVLWHKLAVNSVINPLTAINNIDNGALASRDYKPQVDALCAEVLQVFKRLGIEEPEGGLKYRVEQVILSTAANRSSMLQDISSGKKTEIDYITGALLKAAKALKLDLKAHQSVYLAIKEAEQRE